MRYISYVIINALGKRRRKTVTATKNKQAWKESRSDYPDLVAGTVFFINSVTLASMALAQIS